MALWWGNWPEQLIGSAVDRFAYMAVGQHRVVDGRDQMLEFRPPYIVDAEFARQASFKECLEGFASPLRIFGRDGGDRLGDLGDPLVGPVRRWFGAVGGKRLRIGRLGALLQSEGVFADLRQQIDGRRYTSHGREGAVS